MLDTMDVFGDLYIHQLFNRILRIRAMHEANTALLDILVYNSVIIPLYHLFKRWFTSCITGQNVQKLQILQFFASYIAHILKFIISYQLPIFEPTSANARWALMSGFLSVRL